MRHIKVQAFALLVQKGNSHPQLPQESASRFVLLDITLPLGRVSARNVIRDIARLISVLQVEPHVLNVMWVLRGLID